MTSIILHKIEFSCVAFLYLLVSSFTARYTYPIHIDSLGCVMYHCATQMCTEIDTPSVCNPFLHIYLLVKWKELFSWHVEFNWWTIRNILSNLWNKNVPHCNNLGLCETLLWLTMSFCCIYGKILATFNADSSYIKLKVVICQIKKFKFQIVNLSFICSRNNSNVTLTIKLKSVINLTKYKLFTLFFSWQGIVYKSIFR